MTLTYSQKAPLPVNERFDAIAYVVFGAFLALSLNYLWNRRSASARASLGRARSRSAASPHYSSDSDDVSLDRVPYRNGSMSNGPTLNGKDAHEAEKLLRARNEKSIHRNSFTHYSM